MTEEHSTDNLDLLTENQLLEQSIKRANEGDAEAGKDLLQDASIGLSNDTLKPLLAEYLGNALWDYVHNDIPLDRALNVESEPNTGGRPSYNEFELAAVDALLCEFAGMGKEAAATWIQDNIGPKKRTVQNIRRLIDMSSLDSFDESMFRAMQEALSDIDPDKAEALDYQQCRRERYKDLLLHTAGSMRKKVAEVFA